MTEHDPDEYLSALDEARHEREHLHPHRPQLPPSGRLEDRPRPLTDDERAEGLRRIAELREQIARLSPPGRTS